MTVPWEFRGERCFRLAEEDSRGSSEKRKALKVASTSWAVTIEVQAQGSSRRWAMGSRAQSVLTSGQENCSIPRAAKGHCSRERKGEVQMSIVLLY